MKYPILSLFPGLLSAGVLSLPADEAAPPSLPPVTVTATGYPVPGEETAASVTVIDRETLERGQFLSLTEAVRFQPGLHLADRGTAGSTTGFFVRGTKTEHTSVLMDGIPLPANMAGSFNLETIPLDNIDRVEIFRGPASYLYGQKAIGGVVNLLTLDGRGLAASEGSLWAEGGSFSSFNGGLVSRGPVGKEATGGDYSLQFHLRDTGGFRENADYRSAGGALRWGMDIGDDSRLEWHVRGYESEAGVPGPVRGFGANDPDNRLVTEFYSLAPRWEWEVAPGVRQTLTWQASRFRQAASHFDYFGGNNRVQVNQHWLDWRWDMEPFPGWDMTAGLQGQWVAYSRFNDDLGLRDVKENEDGLAAYWQNRIEPWDGVHFSLGFRQDWTTDFGSHLSGRMGVAWRVPSTDTLLRVSYGSAFSPPSPQDRQPAFYGNSALREPETSRGWELGLEQPLAGDRLLLGVTWFRNELENLIEYDPVTYSLLQTDRALLEGWEFSARWKPSEEWEVHVDYTLLDAANTATGRRLVRRPRHSVNASLDWNPSETLHLGLGVSWVAGREDGFGAGQHGVEDYTVARFLVSWKPAPDWEIFGRVENLLDERYEPVEGFPAARLGVYGGVRWRF